MKATWLSPTLIVAALNVLWPFAHSSLAQETSPSRHILPDDPAAAWAEVSNVHQALRPPAEWYTGKPNAGEVVAFQKKVRAAAVSFANKAREFVERFPTNENVGDARITVVHALTRAVAAGDDGAEKEIQKFVAATLADQSIPEDDRVGVVLFAGNVAFAKKVGMRLFTEGMGKLNEEFETAGIESARAALKQFPTNGMIYTMLVAMAQQSKPDVQKQLATEIVDSEGAPPGAKTLAQHILKGTRPYQVGRPLNIRFTALDGREVDLAKLTGKVVMVEFWSTTCGPCIAEMPMVKAVYRKFHERGFEVVAISLDDKEAALRRFIQEKEMPWPQYFDGKGWSNKFALQYGIFSIPTMWLVDKHGNLRDENARGDLETRVQQMLEEKL